MYVTPKTRKMFRYFTLNAILILLMSACSSLSETEPITYIPCENGFSENYPCTNVDLYAVLTPEQLLGERLNDIWGWTDPETGREYALVGLTDGVTFVDVSIPSEPLVVGKLREPAAASKKNGTLANHEDAGFKGASAWRDLKVYKNHLYVVSEQQNHGLQIFDLTVLRDVENPPVFFEDDARYTLFDNAHNIAINEDTGYAYVVGITSGEVCSENGGLHIINIQSPQQPDFSGCYFNKNAGGITRDGYIHDTQCTMYNGPDENYLGEEICFSSSETVFQITNVSDKSALKTIALESFEGSGYIHQGWLTEDHKYFFMNDEGDERRFGHNTRTYIWNLENLDSPELTGFYEHETRGVDHNLYIHGGFMYQANYTAGLRILDVSNPEPGQIIEAGFFDTTPDSNEPIFSGLWSVYPWFTDHKIVVSDIDNGLFVLRFEP